METRRQNDTLPSALVTKNSFTKRMSLENMENDFDKSRQRAFGRELTNGSSMAQNPLSKQISFNSSQQPLKRAKQPGTNAATSKAVKQEENTKSRKFVKQRSSVCAKPGS